MKIMECNVIFKTHPLNLVELRPSSYLMSGPWKKAVSCPGMKKFPFEINPVTSTATTIDRKCLRFYIYIYYWNNIFDRSYLRISIYRIWMWIWLITSWYTISLNIAHHAIARWNNRRCERFLQLLFLFSIFRAAILKPNLRAKRHKW